MYKASLICYLNSPPKAHTLAHLHLESAIFGNPYQTHFFGLRCFGQERSFTHEHVLGAPEQPACICVKCRSKYVRLFRCPRLMCHGMLSNELGVYYNVCQYYPSDLTFGCRLDTIRRCPHCSSNAPWHIHERLTGFQRIPEPQPENANPTAMFFLVTAFTLAIGYILVCNFQYITI